MITLKDMIWKMNNIKFVLDDNDNDNDRDYTNKIEQQHKYTKILGKIYWYFNN